MRSLPMPSVKLRKHLRNVKQPASRYRRIKLNTSAEKKTLRNNRQLFISLGRPHQTCMSRKILIWVTTSEDEHFGCMNCSWMPTMPTESRDREIAELEFDKHICARWPKSRAQFA